MSILPAPSHPRQEAPKEQMHPIAQDSEEQPRYIQSPLGLSSEA